MRYVAFACCVEMKCCYYVSLIVFQVNEITWNKQNDQFFLTNGNGCVVILRYTFTMVVKFKAQYMHNYDMIYCPIIAGPI